MIDDDSKSDKKNIQVERRAGRVPGDQGVPALDAPRVPGRPHAAAYATSLGKALLAELTEAELTGLLPQSLAPLTENTITSRDKLRDELTVVRERGYAFEHEEGTTGVACVAAVVPYRIPASDALSCSMPADQATDSETRRIGELLAEVTGRSQPAVAPRRYPLKTHTPREKGRSR